VNRGGRGKVKQTGVPFGNARVGWVEGSRIASGGVGSSLSTMSVYLECMWRVTFEGEECLNGGYYDRSVEEGVSHMVVLPPWS
jgi:hypothetical protein